MDASTQEPIGVPDLIPRRKKVHLTVVTNSELETWRACPQKHGFVYRDLLRPMIQGRALAIGGIFHTGMSAGLRAGWLGQWKSKPDEVRLAEQIEAAIAGIDERVMEWITTVMQHGADLDYQRLHEEATETAEMVKWMLTHYFTMTRADLSNLVLVETETPFRVDIHDKRGRVMPHLKYEGVRDAVLFDPSYNQLVLDEHKTCGGDPRQIEKRVEMDSQTKGYLYGLKQQRETMKTVDGESVAGAFVGRVAFNVLRKSKPGPPKVNQNGAVSVAACNTTAAMYGAALDEQVRERKIPISDKQSVYHQTLIGQGDRWFARIEHHQTASEIERWRSDTLVDASRIREADRDSTKRTRNPGNCNMAWSMPCMYRSVCLDNTPEVRSTFRIADDPHGEVRDAEIDQANEATTTENV